MKNYTIGNFIFAALIAAAFLLFVKIAETEFGFILFFAIPMSFTSGYLWRMGCEKDKIQNRK